MPIHFAVEPINGSALVHKGLGRVATRTNPLSARGVDLTTLQLSPPHAVYDLRADLVAAGGGLESANATGFRYLVQAGGGNVAAGEVLADASGAATLLANINYGPFVEATAQGLTEVAKLPAVSAGSFEARLLRFSAIALVALWLKSDSGGGISSIHWLPRRRLLRQELPTRPATSSRPSFRSRRCGRRDADHRSPNPRRRTPALPRAGARPLRLAGWEAQLSSR